MKRKLFVAALVLILALAMLPSFALADGNVAAIGNAQYQSIQAAVDVANNGDVIKLLSNVYLTETVEVAEGKDITLDLNGQAITVYKDKAAGRSLYAVNNYGTFTLIDSVGSGSITARGIQNLGSGNMTVESGKIISCDENGGACIWNEANVVINGGTFETVYVGTANDDYGIGCLNNSGTALVTGGTFNDVNRRTYAIISTGHIEITPAEGKTVTVIGAHGALAVDSGTAVVNGGSYSSSDYYGLYVSNDGMGEDPMTAAVTVNDGTFSGASYSVWIGSDYNNPVNSTIQINGGTYEKPINTQDNTRENAIIVYGGTFNAGIGTGENITISGASTSTTEGGKTTVTPNKADDAVASIERGDQTLYYTSLNDAVAEARDGETVEVLESISIDKALEIKNNITIDGNGNTVTADKCVGLYIKADLSKLTVTDLTLKGVLPEGSLAGEGGTGSYMGIGTYNDCYGVGDLQLTNVTIDGFSYGLYFGINPAGGIGPYNENPVSVTANNLTVQNCYIKGAYFEKLTDSTFTSCKFVNNGTDETKVESGFRTWMCGVDINLKNGSYKNISFVGCTFTNNGANSGTALLIKARDDGNYGKTTSLDGATVSGCTFSGNNGTTPVVIGEPNANNKTPVNVSIQSDVKYTSNVAAASNFTVTFNSNGGTEYATQLVAADSEITLPTPSKSGYIFLGWRCGEDTYSAGATVKVTADMAFTAVWGNLPDVKPDTTPDQPVVTEFPFYDVAASAWYYDAVKYVYDKGLMDGVDTHEFAPNATLTRAMVWTILARAEGVDTTGGASWYAKAQEWAVAKGVSDGENPNAAITRQELVTMLYRLAGSPTVTGSLTAPDASSVSSWAKDAMLWAMNLGLVEGDENGAVTPTATATRAQAAALIMRYIAK